MLGNQLFEKQNREGGLCSMAVLSDFPSKADIERSLKIHKEIEALEIESNYEKEWTALRNRLLTQLEIDPKINHFTFKTPAAFYKYSLLIGVSAEVHLREIFNSKGYEFYIHQDEGTIIFESSNQKTIFLSWVINDKRFSYFVGAFGLNILLLIKGMFNLFNKYAFNDILLSIFITSILVLPSLTIIYSIVSIVIEYLRFKNQISMQKVNNNLNS